MSASPSLKCGYFRTIPRTERPLGSASSSQWRKIALSRAFMRVESNILVLDEPTAAMDASAEAVIFEHCYAAIDPIDNKYCYIPPGWECWGAYGDGVCDCGCGVVDVDCSSNSVEACETCETGCSAAPCPGKISPTDNSVCLPPPPEWHCDDFRYSDVVSCDCGCGIPDPDCTGTQVESCDFCTDNGNCSVQACPGTIDPNDNAVCYQPEPPSWWVCPASAYADGVQCDCGCGAYDLDCPDSLISSCDQCGECGPCPGTVNPMNTPKCL